MTQSAKHSQVISAAKSGLSSRTAGRIDNQIHLPKQASRHWRTREDPLSVICEPIVLPLLQQSEGLTPVGIFNFLCEQHSGQFDPKKRRTLERRINRWRQLRGSAKEVMFTQTHALGALGIADFTVVKESVTIAGVPLKHRLFHDRLVASRWGYAQVVYGGESFTALSHEHGAIESPNNHLKRQLHQALLVRGGHDLSRREEVMNCYCIT